MAEQKKESDLFISGNNFKIELLPKKGQTFINTDKTVSLYNLLNYSIHRQSNGSTEHFFQRITVTYFISLLENDIETIYDAANFCNF